MRCISDELIQKFIDEEASEYENSIVQSHLATCSNCIKKVEERRNTANRIIKLIGSLDKKEIQVPVFQEPENQRKTLHVNIKKVVYVVSAACLLISFFIFYQKPKDEIDYIYFYGTKSEINANLPLSEQEMVLEIIDSKGELIKY